MYRQRLRSRTGCVRCKQRKKKCDEQKPICSYCAKWKTECYWPSENAEDAEAVSIKTNNSEQKEIETGESSRSATIRLLAPRTAIATASGHQDESIPVSTSKDSAHIASSSALTPLDINAERIASQSSSHAQFLHPPDLVSYTQRNFSSYNNLGRDAQAITTALESRFVGPFHTLPLQSRQGFDVAGALNHVYHVSQAHITCYRTSDLPDSMSRGIYWSIVTQDDLTSLCAYAMSEGWRESMDPESLGYNRPSHVSRIRAEARTAELLRVKLSSSMDARSLVQTVVVAAMMICVSNTYSTQPITQGRLSGGVVELARIIGGIEILETAMPISTMYPTIRALMLAAIACRIEHPWATHFSRPDCKMLYQAADILEPSERFSTVCSQDLAASIDDTRLILHFRSTEEQTNMLPSLIRLQCLMALLQFSDCDLTRLYVRHCSRTPSINSCLALTLILIRLEVVSTFNLQPWLCERISSQLLNHLERCPTELWTKSKALDILVWIHILLALHLRTSRTRFLESLVLILDCFFQENQILWEDNWRERVRSLLGHLVWHKRLDKAFWKYCDEIQQQHMLNMEGKTQTGESGHRPI